LALFFAETFLIL